MRGTCPDWMEEESVHFVARRTSLSEIGEVEVEVASLSSDVVDKNKRDDTLIHPSLGGVA